MKPKYLVCHIRVLDLVVEKRVERVEILLNGQGAVDIVQAARIKALYEAAIGGTTNEFVQVRVQNAYLNQPHIQDNLATLQSL